jgi:hypothetical protein
MIEIKALKQEMIGKLPGRSAQYLLDKAAGFQMV